MTTHGPPPKPVGRTDKQRDGTGWKPLFAGLVPLRLGRKVVYHVVAQAHARLTFKRGMIQGNLLKEVQGDENFLPLIQCLSVSAIA
jgi:hypothetical protein